MIKLPLRAIIMVMILLSISTYLMHPEKEIINIDFVMKSFTANESLKYEIKILNLTHSVPNNTSTNRKAYNTSTSRKSYNSATAGRGSQERRLPKALIIGFDKSGTDTLRDMLLMNPNIVGPQKEIDFFSILYSKGIDWYRNRMPISYEDQITIEKSIYIRYPNAHYKIKEFNPKMKLMVIVREPVARLISDYLDFKTHPGRVPKTFEKWVCYGCKDYKFVERSIYTKDYLPQYLKLFPRNQILIVDGDKLKKDPYPVIKEAEQFLDVVEAITPDHFYFNETKGFWCMKTEIEKLRGCIRSNIGLKGRKPPHVDPKLITELRKYYHPYNLEFYRMTGIDFGWPAY